MGFADDRNLLLIILICCSTILSVIGLILGAVSLSQRGAAQYNIYTGSESSGSSSGASDSERVWMIAIGHYDHIHEYLDPVSYQIKGYHIDVIDAVCDIANKNCEVVNDIYENCWNSKPGERPRGGVGLMSGWYDACTGWIQTYDRQLTFDFTRPLAQGGKVAMYVSNATLNFDYTDMAGRKIGFADGWFADEICLKRYSSDLTYPIRNTDLPVDRIIHYPDATSLTQAVISGEVDAVFTINIDQLNRDLRRVTPDDFPNLCEVDGGSMMTQKRNKEFIQWWDDAWGRLQPTSRYDNICQNIRREHAGVLGARPEDVCIFNS